MSDNLLHFLDIFFIVFHTAFTLFNIIGWIWKKTRKLHLITLLLTLFSWLILGIWYGFGYCFCTEWHWQVRAMLGNYPKAAGYIQFLVQELTGLNPGYELTNTVTIIVMILIFSASVSLNTIDFVKWRKKKKDSLRIDE